MKEQLESLNAVAINFGEGGMMAVNIILAFVMFGVALGIKKQALYDIIHKPKSIMVGMMLQWFALPAVTFAVAMVCSSCRYVCCCHGIEPFHHTDDCPGYDPYCILSGREHFQFLVGSFQW